MLIINKNIGSNFDSFLKEEHIFDEAETTASKRILVYQSQKKCNHKEIKKQQIIRSGIKKMQQDVAQ